MNLNIVPILLIVIVVAGIIDTVMLIREDCLGGGFVLSRLVLLGLIIGFSIPLVNDIIKIGGVYISSESEATVLSVGYQGIVIEFYDEYGKERYEDEIPIPHEKLIEYHNGDRLIVQIKDCIFWDHPETQVVSILADDNQGEMQETESAA